MVEWKKLGDVCGIFDGTHQTPKYTDSGIKFVSVENINGLYNSNKFVSEEDFNANYKTKPQRNDVLMTRIGDVGSCAIVDKDEPLAYYVSLALLRPKSNVISGYVKYILESRVGKIELRKRTLLTAVPLKINLGDVGKVCIPIPSLSEQNRIVGILDTFTASIDNLKEQIAQRRKQYEYYRDQLLDLEGKEGVEMKSLGEIGEFIRGNGIQKSDFVEEGFSCIHYGQIHAKYGFSAEETISKIDKVLYKRCKKAKKGDVVLATTSEDAEGVAKPFVWLGADEAAVSGDAFIYHHNQIGKFMGYQFLTNKFMQFKVKYATGAKVVRISGDNMAKFKVALPSIEEQSRIVSILDSFEASIQNLEAQLSQREKQYEYYRNKLLTFE